MGANKLRGKAYAEFLHSLGIGEFSKYLDAHPNEIDETMKAMTEQELQEYHEALFGNLPQEFIDADDIEDGEDYFPEDTEDENVNEFNKVLNEHDRKFWEDRKKGEPIRKTI